LTIRENEKERESGWRKKKEKKEKRNKYPCNTQIATRPISYCREERETRVSIAGEKDFLSGIVVICGHAAQQQIKAIVKDSSIRTRKN
jgi:hypothetical protein